MNNQEKIYSQLDDLFKKIDPWKKVKKYEELSDKNILSLLESIPHASVLEVGCADGKLTKKLVTLSDRVVGIDVSKNAIQKARESVPEATFYVTSLEEFEANEVFDVIICSEVLYYILDHKKAVSTLQKKGRYIITSNFITCLPQICFGSIKYEYYLRKFPSKKTIIEIDARLGLFVIKRLRKVMCAVLSIIYCSPAF